MEEPFDSDWKKKSRILTHALLLSGTLNIGLLGTFIYSVTKSENNSTAEAQRTLSKSNAEVFKAYFELDFEALCKELGNQEQIRDGYRKRDLALACLVGFHHFNLEKALSGFPFQKRRTSYFHEEGTERIWIDLFPGLRDEHYEAIYAFAKREKWPITAEGLFYEMQRLRPDIPSDLKRAFLASPHYYTIRTLLSRSETPLKEAQIFALLLEGNWEVINAFFDSQMASPDLSSDVRFEFLRSFIPLKSKIAAHLIVQGENSDRLENSDLTQVIELLSVKNQKVAAFLQKLMHSPHSEEVRKRAGVKYYALVHDGAIVPYAGRRHIIGEGDSLWKIAKRYSVTIEELAKVNQLEKSDLLRVGRELQVPHPRRQGEMGGT